jgi:methyl coenzyme M reductase beta subunit
VLSPPSPHTASQFITIKAFPHYDPIGLVYSIHDPTEVAIQKMIDASQRMISVQSQVGGAREEDGWGINLVMKRHLELEIKTLQNAPRDADKLRKLLDVKQRQKEEADHIENTQRLVTEIEMLKVVLFLVTRKSR